MASRYTVAVVLDEESGAVWDSLPAGEKSQRVREALKDAGVIRHREMTIEALRRQIKHAQQIIRDVSIFSKDETIRNLVEEYLEGIA